MSGFQKVGGRASIEIRLAGTKLKNGLPCVSLGVPSLDHVVGGSIPVGTIFMIEEDVLRNYSRVMAKFFLAEAIVCKHAVLLASLDDDPKEMVKELPSPTSESGEDNVQNDIVTGEMKIAWRYEGQAVVDSSFGTNTNFGHHFDLSRHIHADNIKTSEINYWNGLNPSSKTRDFKNQYYYDLLSTIKELLKKDEYRLSGGGRRNVLRICISSLGSPLWVAHESEDGYNVNKHGQDIMKFMYLLRIMLRNTAAVALVTIPTHLFEEEHTVKRLLNSVDNAVKLESFAGSDRETNPVFKDYHGLFHITKLSALNTLVPYLPPSLDLAFKLRRKKFVIEKLHLPPELQDSSEREQDDITATATSCGGFKKKDVDF